MIKNPLPLPCMALSSRHAGETPAHPGGVSLYAGWTPVLRGGAS